MIAALWLAAAAPAAAFSPPLDTPVTYTIRETRSNGGTTHTYVQSRTVVFRRDGDGFAAAVTTTAIEAEPMDAKGRMYLAGARGFLGRTLRFRLDRAGGLVAVVDRQREWDGWLTRMTADMKRSSASGFAAIARFVAPLRHAPAEEQARTLGEYVTRIVGTDVLVRGTVPATAIRLPAAGPDGVAQLAGTERIDRSADGLMWYERRADGPAGAGGTMRVTQSRSVDPVSGLVRATRDITRISLGGRTLVNDRSMTVSF